jgi:hypothetical protein
MSADDRAAASHIDALLVVALKTDQPNIERRLRTILAAAEATQPDSETVVWARPVDELVAVDLDALAAIVGWDAVSRLRVGDVAAGGFPTPLAGAASGDGAGLPAADAPHITAARRREALIQRHIWNRVSGVLMLVDALCLIALGRYWALDLKFAAWDAERRLERSLSRV